jgi:uncharacterized membrane protein YkoI
MCHITTRFAAAVAFSMFALVSAGLWGAEESVPLDKVPKPVLDAVKARFKDAKLTEASKETEDGKLVYEVTVNDKGQHIDVTLTPDGEIVLIEKTIAAKDLPKPVTKALEEKYAKATYKIVEEIIKVEKKEEKLAYYEVLLVTADKKKLEVEVSAEGKIIKVEDKGAGKDDK